MPHLVIGGTGNVGSEVVRQLTARGEKVRVLTRSAEKAKQLPAGVEGVTGDLTDPSTYPGVFTQDIDGVFLLSAVSNTELNDGLAAVVESKRAGAKRIVYLSVQEPAAWAHVPHFVSKAAIETAIAASGIPYTILRPNNFYQNDVRFLEAITKHGVYPAPIGSIGLSRVDVRDVGLAALNAFTQPGHENRTYTLAGPEPITGESSAALWTKALGREVRYAGDDLVSWAKNLLSFGIPAWMVYDFGLMYDMFQKKGFLATPKMLEETRTALGRDPLAYADYVNGLAASLAAS